MKKIGVFGTCRIDNYNILDFKNITPQFPRIYQNNQFTINVRPLGYTTTSSDILQNLTLISNGKYKEITDNFVFKNIFQTHHGTKILSDLDYEYLVLEICSVKKIVHKETNYIFPYEVDGKAYNETEFLTETETFDETISNILQIRDLIKCKIILLPPICVFNGPSIIGIHENTIPSKVLEYRKDIFNRLKTVSNEKDIFLFDWNKIIKEKGCGVMLVDQFHFTDFGQKYISEKIYNTIISNKDFE